MEGEFDVIFPLAADGSRMLFIMTQLHSEVDSTHRRVVWAIRWQPIGNKHMYCQWYLTLPFIFDYIREDRMDAGNLFPHLYWRKGENKKTYAILFFLNATYWPLLGTHQWKTVIKNHLIIAIHHVSEKPHFSDISRLVLDYVTWAGEFWQAFQWGMDELY